VALYPRLGFATSATVPPPVGLARTLTNGNGHANGNGHTNGNGHASRNGHAHGNGHAHTNGHDSDFGGARWWVARTLSRQEKALGRRLLHWEIPYYLPQREHRFRVADRWRTSYLPLFTGYVFFHGDLHDRLVALRTNVIVKLIEAPEPDELAIQLRSLWLVQMSGAPLVPHPYLGPGDEVEVMHGPLRGYRGVVMREKGKYRLVISITLLQQSVATEIDRDLLAPSALRRVRVSAPPPRPAILHAGAGSLAGG
jgi:transcriptional antiterminator RfaH